jgi:predicted dehydrogenase
LDAARCESVRAALAKDNLPHDWAFFNDYRKLLKEIKPDVVSVALPNFLHAPVTLDALRAGAHVLCEKPPAMNVREAVAMEKEARKRGRALSFNLSYRAAPASLLLKKWTDENRLGPIYHARTIWHRQRGIPKGTGWFFDAKRAGGGPLIDLGVHRIDLAWWLMGEPEPATVSAATFRKFGPKVHGPQYTVEDFGSGFVRFKDGRTLSLEISWHSFCEKKETMSTELFGEKGGAVQRNTPAGGYEFECLLFQEMGGERVEVKPSALPKPGPEDNAAAQLCRFIQDGTPLSISARSGVCLQRILDGLYASAKIGREVKA